MKLRQAMRSLSNSLFILQGEKRDGKKGRGVIFDMLPADTKTFPKWKLRKYKSDVNETYMINIPLSNFYVVTFRIWSLSFVYGENKQKTKKPRSFLISIIYLHSSSWKERGVYASFPEVRKYLQTENSGTQNQTSMKLGPDMYHLNTFHFQKNGCGNWWAGHKIH